MTDTERSSRDAAGQLDGQLVRSLRLIAPPVGLVYVASAFLGLNPAAPVLTALVCGLVFLAVGLVLVVRPLPARLAHPLLVAGAVLVTLEALTHGRGAENHLAWALVASAAVATRPRWYLATAAATVVPWLLATLSGAWGWDADPGPAVSDIAAACIAGGVVFFARHGAVTGLVTARGTMQTLAHTDPLTALLNRRGIEEAAVRLLSDGAFAGLAIVYVDLDGFKSINDRHGHAEGDRALCAVAASLHETFRAADVVGRIGGDEFLVVMPPASDVTVAANRLRQRLAAWRDETDRYRLNASIGVGHVDGRSLEAFWEAVDAADRRMYREKEVARAVRAAVAPLGSRGASSIDLVPALN